MLRLAHSSTIDRSPSGGAVRWDGVLCGGDTTAPTGAIVRCVLITIFYQCLWLKAHRTSPHNAYHSSSLLVLHTVQYLQQPNREGEKRTHRTRNCDEKQNKTKRLFPHRKKVAPGTPSRAPDVRGRPVSEGNLLQLRQQTAHAQTADQRPLLRDAHAPQLQVELSQPWFSIFVAGVRSRRAKGTDKCDGGGT